MAWSCGVWRSGAVALATALLTCPRAQAEDEPRPLHYDLHVTVRDHDLAVTETVRLGGTVPKKLALELVDEMKVLAVESGGAAVPFTTGRNAV